MDDITRIQRYFAQKSKAQPRVESTVNTDGKPCAVNIACVVWVRREVACLRQEGE